MSPRRRVRSARCRRTALVASGSKPAGAPEETETNMRKFVTSAALLGAAALSAISALAGDGNQSANRGEVVYINAGQSRVVLPAASLQRPEGPYALSGQNRTPDAWEREGHWINAGQTRIFVPP